MASDDVASNMCPTRYSGTTRSESLETEEESPDKRWHRSEAGPRTVHSFPSTLLPSFFFLYFSILRLRLEDGGDRLRVLVGPHSATVRNAFLSNRTLCLARSLFTLVPCTA